MKMLNASEFFASTMGGLPPQANMNAYNGKKFNCGCGAKHVFNARDCGTHRELRGMKFVIECPEGKVLNLIQIGTFSMKMKMLFSTPSDDFESVDENLIADLMCHQMSGGKYNDWARGHGKFVGT